MVFVGNVIVEEAPLTREDEEAFYEPEPLAKLRRDLRQASRTLSEQEVRYIVSTYYIVQNYRIKASNQIRSLDRAEEPVALLSWIQDNVSELEKEIQKWMQGYAESRPTGQWMLSIMGIGPVIAAGMLAHLDMTKTTNIDKWWAFAGFDPTKSWTKGERRPWNAQLKVLGYKAGESFVKVQNREGDYYGQLYKRRKAEYTLKNETGGYADRAAQILASKKYGKETDAYKAYSEGKLPLAHIHAMARRWAIKIFMSHMWTIAYEEAFAKIAPNPWILEPNLGGHTDRLIIPNHECPYGPNH